MRKKRKDPERLNAMSFAIKVTGGALWVRIVAPGPKKTDVLERETPNRSVRNGGGRTLHQTGRNVLGQRTSANGVGKSPG